ncbi:hypothetical protein WCLP8_1320004 [uncultured Gammaproteobacteria bacterium]
MPQREFGTPIICVTIQCWHHPVEYASDPAAPETARRIGFGRRYADGGSSSGRTADSDSASLGSNPSPPTNDFIAAHTPTISLKPLDCRQPPCPSQGSWSYLRS